MKNMAFSMTEPQFRDRSKDVTRRLGYSDAKPGDHIGSVPCKAILMGRRALGTELNADYVKCAARYCEAAEAEVDASAAGEGQTA